MCGICGFTGALDNRDDVIKRMTEVITHRGPDSDGIFCDETIAMGFRRLSIIDLETGHQPIYNEAKTLVLTFNGEIYNYKQLKEELIAKGHRFATESDSEVLVHGFEEWNEDLLPRLRGMFAFAIYNTVDKTVFIARDPFGIKPMHYTQIGNDLVYASEIKSILEHPKFEKRFNRRALDTYLSYQYALPPETFFEEVYVLLPGHYLWFQNGAVETFRYFEPRFRPDKNLTEDEAVEKIEKVFEDSVNAHKIADVEVGCFLSSGVDSSYVSTYFSGQKTFTVGFDYGEKYNEISWAESLSKLIDVEHHTHLISSAEFWDAVPTVQYYMDQPLADPSCVALYFVSRLASQYVKVVLSGEGADELFGGYTCYNDPRVFKVYQTIVPHFLRKAFRAVARKLPDIKGRDYVIRACDKLEERYIGNAFMYDLKEKQRLLKEPAIATAPQRYARKHYYRCRRCDDVTKMQYLDINMWLTGDILLKADRMSMANSLELRVPFLDKEVFKVASSLPTDLRVNKHNTKYALRKAAAKHMPETTAEKEKLGFPVPTRVWLREEKYYNIVRDRFDSETAEKFFNTDELMKWLDRHFIGKEDNSRRIWTVYVFLVWYDIYFNDDNPRAEKPANRLDELKAAAEAVRAGRPAAPQPAEVPTAEAPDEEASASLLDRMPALETVAVPAAVAAAAAGDADEITEDVFDEDLPDDIEETEEDAETAAAADGDGSWESAFEEPLPEDMTEDEEAAEAPDDVSEDTEGEAPAAAADEEAASEAYTDEEAEPEEYNEEAEPEEYAAYDEDGEAPDDNAAPEEYADEEGEAEEYGEYYEDGDVEEYYDEDGNPIGYYDENGEPVPYYDEDGNPIEYYDEDGETVEYYDEDGEPAEYDDESGEPEEYDDESGETVEYDDESGEPAEYDDESGEPAEYYDDEEYRDTNSDDEDAGEGYWEDEDTAAHEPAEDADFDDTKYGDEDFDEYLGAAPAEDESTPEEPAEEEVPAENENTWDTSFQNVTPEIIEEDGEEFIDISVFGTGQAQVKTEPAPAPSRTVFDDVPFLSRFFKRKNKKAAAEEPAAQEEAAETEAPAEEELSDEPAADAVPDAAEAPAEELTEEAAADTEPAEDEPAEDAPAEEDAPDTDSTEAAEEPAADEALPEDEAAPDTDDAPATPQEQMQQAIDSIEKRAKNLDEPNVMSDEAVSQIRFFDDEDDND